MSYCSKARPFGLRLNSAKEMVGGNVKDRPVVTPVAVGCFFARVDGAEMFAVRSEHMNAARAGGEEVPIFIYFHAIRQARPAFHPGSGVEEDAPIANSSVRLHLVGHPDGFVW